MLGGLLWYLFLSSPVKAGGEGGGNALEAHKKQEIYKVLILNELPGQGKAVWGYCIK